MIKPTLRFFKMVPSYYGLVHFPQSLDWCIRSLLRGIVFQIFPCDLAKIFGSNRHRGYETLSAPDLFVRDRLDNTRSKAL